MFYQLKITAIGLIVLAVSGCQTGQYQSQPGGIAATAAIPPSTILTPAQQREVTCRQRASSTQSRANTSNPFTTLAGSVAAGMVSSAIGVGVGGYGYHIGAATGSAVSNSMAQNPQMSYESTYTNCMRNAR